METIIFEKTLYTQEGEKERVGYWNADSGILSIEDLLREINFLLEDGYKVKIVSDLLIENKINFDYLKRMSEIELSSSLARQQPITYN